MAKEALVIGGEFLPSKAYKENMAGLLGELPVRTAAYAWAGICLSKHRIPIDIEDIDLAVFKSAFQCIKTMVPQIGMLSIGDRHRQKPVNFLITEVHSVESLPQKGRGKQEMLHGDRQLVHIQSVLQNTAMDAMPLVSDCVKSRGSQCIGEILHGIGTCTKQLNTNLVAIIINTHRMIRQPYRAVRHHTIARTSSSGEQIDRNRLIITPIASDLRRAAEFRCDVPRNLFIDIRNTRHLDPQGRYQSHPLLLGYDVRCSVRRSAPHNDRDPKPSTLALAQPQHTLSNTN
ncbi:hypothetical protein A3768_5348 (plasmid) [Ralstonia solanacearum]|nr:hypothetical protein A3768_5348 [Ralstonia solanacearum]